MVLVHDFEFQLALHVKRNKVKLAFLTVILKKREFLQTTSNIGILYTIRKHVSP